LFARKTNLVVQGATGQTVSVGHGVDVRGQILQSSAAGVLDTVLVVLAEPHQSGETGHTVRGGVLLVLVSVDLDDQHIRLASESGAQLLVVGGQSLAVTAPWCIELNQNILGGIL